MWPFNLSVRLPIVDLVSRYLTNYLIGREPIFQRIAPLITVSCGTVILCGISICFQMLSPSERQVAHALLTRPPLGFGKQAFQTLVRLACVRHAASVHPEPGSNSLKFVSYPPKRLQSISELVLLLSYQETFVSRNYFVASSQTRISGFLVSFVV